MAPSLPTRDPPGRHQTRALATRAEILTADPHAIDDAAALLETSLAEVDRLASRFRDDSELSALNASAGKAFRTSPELLEALEVAIRAARLTGGLVTPTVGRAMGAIGYDRDFAALESDGADGIDGADGAAALPPAAPVPAWELVELDRAARTVRVPAGVQLDLGATAKAWAADRIAARAAGSLGCGVLVSLGGDVAMAGNPPVGGWSVGVADGCDTEAGDADEVVCLHDGGLATSGTATRSWRRGGRAVHHLIDPATGLPADSRWRTVTVAAARCVDANTASTAAFIRSATAPAWLGALGLPARLVGTNGRVVVVGRWPRGAQG